MVCTWSNGPCYTSLSGLLCTNINIDDMHLAFGIGVASLSCHGCLPARQVYKTNSHPQQRKPQTLTLKWVSLGRARDSACVLVMCCQIKITFCAALDETCARPPWTPRCVSSYGFCSVFFTATDFSHDYNLLSSTASSSGKIIKLG